MQQWGLIGDSHLGFKTYGTDLRSQETIDVFRQGVEKLSDKPIIFFAGDFFDDTGVPNWIKKQIIAIKEEHKDQIWFILGGNHDSTKTYSSVSALDVFGEVNNVIVVNSHKEATWDICGLRVLCIPHVKSQTEYLSIIDSCITSDTHWDLALLHSLVNSKLDLGPNDLNIDLCRLDLLAQKCDKIFIGHQHQCEQPLPNVIIPGSTLEFDFGQLGDKFVYTESEAILLDQPRKMVRYELNEIRPIDILELGLSEDTIYRIDIQGIPIEEYSNVKTACDVAESNFKGVVMFNLYKTGHKELQVTAIDARFDLMEEFDTFCAVNNITVGRMKDILQDAVSLVSLEED